MKDNMAKKFITLVVLIGLIGVVLNSLAQEPAPQVLNDTLDNDTPFIEYPITLEADNTGIQVDIQATSGDLDTLLYLVDETGNIIAENDDRESGNYNSLIRYERLPRGTYTVVATRYGIEEGASAGDFDIALELLPASSPELPEYAVSEDALTAVGYPVQAVSPQAEWTILAYYNGDNNLEDGILNDLDEFELAGGSTERVRIIVLVDRSPKYTDSNGDWADVRLFEVMPDVSGDHLTMIPATIDTPALAELGELDTGNGETLAQFLVWGIRHYPANHYAISIGSHGAGWHGLSTDETAGEAEGGRYTIITLPEMRQALELARQTAQVSKFDLLINDACLMSSVEYNAAMVPYFNLSLASPEVVVNPALDMNLFTRTIQDALGTDVDALGTLLVDKYITEDILQRGDSSVGYYTNALTDLNNYDPVLLRVEEFARLVNENPELYVEGLGRARANAYTYTAFLGDSTKIDLGHFMEQVIINSRDVRLITAAEAVLEALQNSRVYGNAGEIAEQWSYYNNIYFPEDSSDFEWAYLEETSLDEWAQMIQTYYNVATPRRWEVADSVLLLHPPQAPKVTITQVFPSVTSIAQPPSIKIEIQGRRIARGSFTVDQIQADGSAYRFLSTPILTEVVIGGTANFVNQWRSGVDQSEFSWLPMTLPVISDGTVSANELLIKSGDVAILEGRTRETADQDWQDVALIFSLETGVVQRVIGRATGTGAVAEVSIRQGDSFQSYRQLVSPDGRILAEPGTEYIWQDYGLRWIDSPAPSGDYNLGFFVEAFGGISGFDSAMITVNNEGVPADSRGYTDLTLGMSFAVPADWVVPFDTGSQIVSGNGAVSENLSIAYFNAERDNPYKIAEDYQVSYGLAATDAGALVTLHDQQALRFGYSYTLEGDSAAWYGSALAFYRETARQGGGTGIVFALEARTPEAATARLDALLTQLNLFDSVALADANTSAWRYRFIQPTVAHPVPIGWDEGEAATEAGQWTRFTNDAFPGGVAQVAFFDVTEVDTAYNQLQQAGVIPPDARVVEYRNDEKVWRIASFNSERDGVALTSRVYITTVNAQAFALWFEAPDDENAVALFRNVFEPMVDGFAPSSNVQYALGGLNPTLLKAVMTRASLACDEIGSDDACYGEGSLIAETVQTVDTVAVDAVDTGENFATIGDTVGIASLQEIAVGIAESLENSFDSFSIAVMEPQVPVQGVSEPVLDENNNPVDSIRMGVFGGVTIINEVVQDVPTATPAAGS